MPSLPPISAQSPLDTIAAVVPIGTVRQTVCLIDGTVVRLAEYGDDELNRLHYDQEQAFAAAILRSRKGTPERLQITRHAYETVCQILDEIAKRHGNSGLLSMGMDPRYQRLVLELLSARRRRGSVDGLFEVGFGSGQLLKMVSDWGHPVAGLEVAGQLHRSACDLLAPSQRKNLLLGNFLTADLSDHIGRYGIVYWNDVFEHIPVDEIGEYLTRIRSLLVAGGQLVTITPNWHMRPSDVTGDFLPPRSEATGFHLKEYRLGEVRDLLITAGFSRVQSPIFISLKKIWFSPIGNLTRLKIACEPLLERLPFRVAVQCCRRFGFNCSVATN
jgi:2-polyprenyl-3-methyl-5-hydroxy-6-metoxy-1,4-benzoquinol methylase